MTDHTIHLLIHPHDTWYFRDGRNHNGSAQIAAVSKVIPPQRTILGALMSLLKASVSSELIDTDADCQQLFHSDWNDYSPVRLSTVRIKYEEKYYIPAPRLIVEKVEADHEPRFACLQPNGKVFDTDLGKLNGLALPEGEQDYRHRQLWLEQSAIITDDSVELTKKILDLNELFVRETRLGIGLNTAKKNVNDGKIYLTEHLRATQDLNLSFAVSLTLSDELINAEKIKTDFSDYLEKGKYVRFGAEGRMAYIEQDRVTSYSPQLDEATPLFILSLLSPAPVSPYTSVQQNYPDSLVDHLCNKLPGCTFLNLLTDRPTSVGGWKSGKKGHGGNRSPGAVDSEYYLSAGSCALFQLPSQTSSLNEYLTTSGICKEPFQLHSDQTYGYGHYTLIPLKYRRRTTHDN